MDQVQGSTQQFLPVAAAELGQPEKKQKIGYFFLFQGSSQGSALHAAHDPAQNPITFARSPLAQGLPVAAPSPCARHGQASVGPPLQTL